MLGGGRRIIRAMIEHWFLAAMLAVVGLEAVAAVTSALTWP